MFGPGQITIIVIVMIAFFIAPKMIPKWFKAAGEAVKEIKKVKDEVEK